MNKIEFLIIHTEGSPVITNDLAFNRVNEYHKLKGFDKSSLGFYCGYHYFIEKSGLLIQARLDTDEGMHTKGYNFQSLGICMAGNGDTEMPTSLQIETLKKWLLEKTKQYNISKDKILPHRKFLTNFEKSCYGSLLPDNWAMNLLDEEINNLKKQISLLQQLLVLWKKLKSLLK